MKKYIVLIIILLASIGNAQTEIKIYYEKINDEFRIYADNDEYCPVSVKIDFDLKNMEVEGGNHKVYVIEPKSRRQGLTKVEVSNKRLASNFKYKYWTNYGNHHQDKYDEGYSYDLPFKSSSEHRVYQGYNGTFSHQNSYALDITMPIGTDIMAIREGVVTEVVEKNTKNCGREECKKYNNKIIIYHPDGTFAEYTHIQQNGSIVEVGDKISKGQHIGYSGNVGWSTGPHLHLVVFKQKLFARETLETKFRTGDGTQTEYLVEKETYSRDY